MPKSTVHPTKIVQRGTTALQVGGWLILVECVLITPAENNVKACLPTWV